MGGPRAFAGREIRRVDGGFSGRPGPDGPGLLEERLEGKVVFFSIK